MAEHVPSLRTPLEAPSCSGGTGATMPPKTTSVQGLAFIAQFEGFVATCYDDAAGNCTIGYGHLVHVGNTTNADRMKWRTITRPQGLELLREDVRLAEKCVLAHVNPPIQLQERFDALVSFTFNLGCGPLIGPSHLRDSVNNPKREGMPEAMLPYNHAGGKVIPGLTRRRAAEARLWSTGKYSP